MPVQKEISYRLGYNYFFLATSPFIYKGEETTALSIEILFRLFDPNGEEVLFPYLGGTKIPLPNGQVFYLNQVLDCFIDQKKGIRFERKRTSLKRSGYTVRWEVFRWYKEVEIRYEQAPKEMQSAIDLLKEKTYGVPIPGMLDTIEISKEEFMDMLRRNIELFMNVGNRPAQVPNYYMEAVEQDT